MSLLSNIGDGLSNIGEFISREVREEIERQQQIAAARHAYGEFQSTIRATLDDTKNVVVANLEAADGRFKSLSSFGAWELHVATRDKVIPNAKKVK